MEQRPPPSGHEHSILPVEPSLLAESDAESRKAAAALLASSLSASTSGGTQAAGETDPLFFYLRMRGEWGSFVGTGAGDIVRAAEASADDAYVAGGGLATAAPPEGTSPQRAILHVPHDPWFPHGGGGGFLNVGLLNWLAMRSAWLSRPPGFVEPPYPPELDSEELIDNLARLQRTYTLPGPVRLPDLIDLYQDIWEEEMAPHPF